jgi:LytS/YehU family sensor histidine kinase
VSGKHDDEIFAHAIALEIRRNAPEAFQEPQEIPQTGESYVKQRLDKLYGQKYNNNINQSDYF